MPSFFIIDTLPYMKWALVLSGGAAYGMANAGVLESLEEANLKPNVIAGSSMGAIVGALQATGHDSRVFRNICREVKLRHSISFSEGWLSGKLHGGFLRQRLDEYLLPYIGNTTIGDCITPFVCIAGRVIEPVKWNRIVRSGFADYIEGCVEKYVFGPEVKLMDAIMASSAIPVVFSPAEIDGEEYIDLVHYGALPARTVKELHNPDVIIATDTSPRHEDLHPYLPKPWREFLERGLEENKKSRAVCDMIIEPRMPQAAWRFDKGEAFMEAGKNSCNAVIKGIKALLE